MTIASEGGALVEGWSVVGFTPRRPGETVGALSAQHGDFTFHGSANLDIAETVVEFWRQAEVARADHEHAQELAKQAEGLRP